MDPKRGYSDNVESGIKFEQGIHYNSRPLLPLTASIDDWICDVNISKGQAYTSTPICVAHLMVKMPSRDTSYNIKLSALGPGSSQYPHSVNKPSSGPTPSYSEDAFLRHII